MELTVSALCLRCVDYKDNDKMATLYTLERGKIGVGARGVKKAGAKLNFCVQPFCFAEYTLNERSGRYTVTGASEIGNFYKLRLNVRAFYAACVISEFLLKFTEEDQPDGELFACTIKAVEDLCADNADTSAVLIKFLSDAFGLLGYGAEFSACGVCGDAEIGSRAFFDFGAGVSVCENCAGAGVTEIKPSTLNALRVCASGGVCDVQSERGALLFFNRYALLKCGDRLKTLSEYADVAVPPAG